MVDKVSKVLIFAITLKFYYQQQMLSLVFLDMTDLVHFDLKVFQTPKSG